MINAGAPPVGPGAGGWITDRPRASRERKESAQKTLDDVYSKAPRYARASDVEMALALGGIRFNTPAWFWVERFADEDDAEDEAPRGKWIRTTGGRIICRLDRDAEGAVRLRVSDTGAGIDPKFLPSVFDRFRQADSSSTRSHGGLGIGLTIVRGLAELHGGRVSASSEGYGRGAEFVVRLPVAPAAAPVEELPPASPIFEKVAHPRRILVVEDQPAL